MEDADLAAQIARLEAELAHDDGLKNMQQQQPNPFAAAAAAAAAHPQPANPFAPVVPPQQQQQQQAPAPSNPFNLTPNPFAAQQQQQDQQQQMLMQQQQLSFQQQYQPPQQQQQAGGSGGAQPGQPLPGTHVFSKDTDARSVFVGNLPKGEGGGATTTPEELCQFFSDCGPILTCTVLKDRATGELKGTAYVEFASFAGMGHAIDTKNNAVFKGSTVIVC